MDTRPQGKKNGGHAKLIMIVFLVVAALIVPFFLASYKTTIFHGGVSSAGISGKNTASGQGFGDVIDKMLQLGYQLIYIERMVDEKLSRTSYAKLEDIAPDMQDSIVAIEDNRFYRHHGLDAEGVFRATLVNVRSGSVIEGGSTITQQLAKNLFLSQERSWQRKLEELILALRIEHKYSKADILEMYLNTIYFGSGAYGVVKASAIYFDKRPSELNLAESALLAGLPNAPSLNSPYVNLAAAKKRQALVLEALVRHKYIEPDHAQEAQNAPLKFAR